MLDVQDALLDLGDADVVVGGGQHHGAGASFVNRAGGAGGVADAVVQDGVDLEVDGGGAVGDVEGEAVFTHADFAFFD